MENIKTIILLKDCEYVVKEKETSKFITDHIEISSDDSDRENSDEEYFNEENKIWKFLIFGVRKSYFSKYKDFFTSGLWKFPPEI